MTANSSGNDHQADEEFSSEQNRRLCVADEKSVRLWDGEKWYEIEFSACNTNEKIIQWIDCLTGQSWITVKHIELFIREALSKRTSYSRK